MEKIRTYEDLKVWKKAHALVLLVYKFTKSFPVEERYGLVSQIRRAAVSIPANIVEGHKRKSTKEYAHFVNIAGASLAEVKYFILLSRDLSYLSENDYGLAFEHSEEIGKMLHGLYLALSRRRNVP